ncbi:MAG: hypothetical protein V9E96_11925 [Chitinophagaceae bacterium]
MIVMENHAILFSLVALQFSIVKQTRPIEILKPEISIEQNFNYTSTFTSQYAPDFWQPPKVV